MPAPFDPQSARTTLFAAILEAAGRPGRQCIIIEDAERNPLSYGRLILASLGLGGRLATLAKRGEAVGVLLPNLTALAATLLGLNAFGRVAALLNFTAGVKNLRSALNTGRIGVVVTTRRFIDTAKLVDIDAEGFITIKGRAKRFAKIGGEMVSLAAVESMISGVWPGINHVVVSLPDVRKGEQLVLVTEKPDADRASLHTRAKAEGFAELWLPRAVLVVGSIPILGSGKIDYTATRELVKQMRPLL